LVVCEGIVTERTYLNSLKHLARNPLVQLEISKKHGVPKTVVECAVVHQTKAAQDAKRERDSNLLYDEVWAVFDVDEHPHIDIALDLAKRHDISVALSSPSFEIGALLHFQTQTRAEDRKKVRALLKKHLPEYDKELNALDLEDGYPMAVRRAVALAKEAADEREVLRNPSTGMYLLAQRIRSGA